jgi:hypothetical protein
MKARSLVLAIISGIFFWFQLVLVNPLMVGCEAEKNSFVLKPVDNSQMVLGSKHKGQLGDWTTVNT